MAGGLTRIVMTRHSQVAVNILLDEEEPYPEVLQNLERAGFHVIELLSELGVAIGSAKIADLEGLRRIRGVLAVERSREMEVEIAPR
jgi:hypothetical protein